MSQPAVSQPALEALTQPTIHDAAACLQTVSRLRAARAPRAVIVGNPNVGKTTLVNGLAGTNLKVGNWSGVTVEKREASLTYQGRRVQLLDLPGAYSLSPHTPEELITRTALLDEAPEVAINVLDAGNLERNLYLTLQLMDFRMPIVVALNLVDEAKDKGMAVDAAALERALGVPVIETVASRGSGLGHLIGAALERAEVGQGVSYPEAIEGSVAALVGVMEGLPTLPPHAYRYLALALLEGDPSIRGRLAATGHSGLLQAADAQLRLLDASGEDALITVA